MNFFDSNRMKIVVLSTNQHKYKMKFVKFGFDFKFGSTWNKWIFIFFQRILNWSMASFETMLIGKISTWIPPTGNRLIRTLQFILLRCNVRDSHFTNYFTRKCSLRHRFRESNEPSHFPKISFSVLLKFAQILSSNAKNAVDDSIKNGTDVRVVVSNGNLPLNFTIKKGKLVIFGFYFRIR